MGKLYNSYSQYHKVDKPNPTRLDTYPKFTNYNYGWNGTIDHIFHNEGFETMEVLEIPEDEKLMKKDGRGLPNSLFPSDHLRIEVLLKLNI